MMVICYYTFSTTIDCTTSKMTTQVYYGLWVIIMWQCSFILGQKCTILKKKKVQFSWLVFITGESPHVWEKGVNGKSLLHSLFCCQLKPFWKKVYLEKTDTHSRDYGTLLLSTLSPLNGFSFLVLWVVLGTSYFPKNFSIPSPSQLRTIQISREHLTNVWSPFHDRDWENSAIGIQ